MRRSLYTKFILGYIVFGLLGFLTVAFISSRLTYDFLLSRTSENLYNEASLMADTYTEIFNSYGDIESNVSSQIDIIAEYLDAYIWVADDSGLIVLDSNSGSFNGVTIPDFNPASGQGLYTTGNFGGMFTSDMLTVSAPLISGYTTTGYILIHKSINSIMAASDSFINIIYISAAIIFLLSLIIIPVFTFTVYIPLKKITDGANEYAKGNLSYKIDMDNKHDEMGYLAQTLNYMAGELNNLEKYQKDFIANVSHDFRSPLTSIKGYLEAILDGTIPPELSEKYIGRVISETERLTKLTQGMLTLNSLDSKGFLSRSVFDINAVIKDVCTSFEGVCNKRGISFDFTFVEEKEQVFADLSKIQQVLYNLVDNAIKFSHDNSVIYIQVTIRQRKTFVSVKDTGIGIPKDSIKKIWDRFYKSDSSRGKDKKGTGLGLAIVKEIIQSHGEQIDVVSTEKVGTEFIFSLPCADETY